MKKSSNNISERDRLDAFMRLRSLREQVAQGNIGKAYLWKEKLMSAVQAAIVDLAPQGVASQAEFSDLIDKAVGQVDKETRLEAPLEAEMADIELTLGMIERTLKMVPHSIFFASL